MRMPQVVRAEYCDACRIRVTFSDGAAGVVDFAPWLTGRVFEPLHDVAVFRQFFIDGGTVAWPNGADIAPETLHEAVLAEPTAAPQQRGRV